MSRLTTLSFGLLAAGIAIADPISGRMGASALAAPDAIGRAPSASGSGLPGADPNSGDFRWRLLTPHPCVRDTVVLAVAGFEPTPCDSFIAAFARDQTHVVYHTEIRDSIACPAVLPRIYPIRIPLGLFPAGPQRIEVEWVIDIRAPSGSITTEVRHIPIDFVVSADCTRANGPLYVDHVQVGPPDGPNPPCVQAGDSIAVKIDGHFPNGCFHLVRVEVFPITSPMPVSPGVRLTVEDCACCAYVCTPEPQPWSASIKLPPLPPSAYKLLIEVIRTSCGAPVEHSTASFPYGVSESCGNPPGCLIPVFAPGETSRECNARIAPGQPARLTLLLHSTVAIAGLQGELQLGDAALQITGLAPTGAAEGMLFRWAPTERGARFTMLSDQGVVIPPITPGDVPPAVLAIVVEVREGHVPPPATLLVVTQLIASDPAGHEVPWCPTLDPNSFRFAAYARICAGPAGQCDFNGDGREDIRDLVLMVRCLRDATLCADPTTGFDCNQDGAFTLDDVLCCAERILGHDCLACPPGQTRDARDLKLGLGPPVGRLPSPGLPVRIEGASSVGGARLTLRFPDDRYEVSGVDFGSAASSWIHVTQVSGGRVVVGLVYTAAEMVPETQIAFTLNLALKPGREPGGEVTLESADLTGPDGVRLKADVPALRQPLGGTPRIALSESRPNPFGSSTRFAVTLDRPGTVEVGIYDLGGRRLVTLHRGELAAGTREFSWDGRLASGAQARDGVYFYRATAGAEATARKLVLLRSP